MVNPNLIKLACLILAVLAVLVIASYHTIRLGGGAHSGASQDNNPSVLWEKISAMMIRNSQLTDQSIRSMSERLQKLEEKVQQPTKIEKVEVIVFKL